jgi:imidazolonepropionase
VTVPGATLFLHASEVVTCAGPPRARRGSELRDAGIRRGVGVAVVGDRIAAVESEATLRARFPSAAVVDCGGGVLTPGLVDCHTHALFGRPRYEEHERRALGEGYQAIAAAGGGIHASVRDLRERTDHELSDATAHRLARVAAGGVTTIEVKSGYGLATDQELRSLRLIDDLGARLPLRVVPTWLGAHEIPLAARTSAATRGQYLRALIEEQLPAVAAQGLARFADVFCEPGVFTVAESRALLTAAQGIGLGVKLHADELTGAGGAELAVELGAVSADHLAAISDAGVTALARSDTVAVLLPATLLFLGTGRQAPARRLVEAGAAIALASDLNPGSSPLLDFGLVLTLGVSVLRLAVAEVLLATTVNAAAALGLAGRTGQLAPGFSADLALFRARDARELPYWMGERLCTATWTRGTPCHPVTPSLLAESPG